MMQRLRKMRYQNKRAFTGPTPAREAITSASPTPQQRSPWLPDEAAWEMLTQENQAHWKGTHRGGKPVSEGVKLWITKNHWHINWMVLKKLALKSKFNSHYYKENVSQVARTRNAVQLYKGCERTMLWQLLLKTLNDAIESKKCGLQYRQQ